MGDGYLAFFTSTPAFSKAQSLDQLLSLSTHPTLKHSTPAASIWFENWGVGGVATTQILGRVGRGGVAGGSQGGAQGESWGSLTSGKILLYLIMYRKYVRKC